jgi:predicted aspartyl protease
MTLARIAAVGFLLALAGCATMPIEPPELRPEPELELVNNRLFVPAIVNGQLVSALLDSAAEMTILDDDFAARLGLVATGSATAHGSGAAAMEARFAEDVDIGMGGIQLRGIRVAVLDLGEVSGRLLGRPVDAILGREVFDAGPVLVDIEGRMVTAIFADAIPAGVRLPLSNLRGTPAIPAAVEGHDPVQAVFDLGNGSEVLIGRAYAERLGLTAPERIVERRRGGGLGGAREREIVVLRNLSVAGREFRDVPAAIDPGETASDLNLGTSILRHFIITTDFARRAIWLEPRE